MKVKIKRIALILIVVTLLLSSITGANAVANKIGSYVLNGGVGNWGYNNRNFL